MQSLLNKLRSVEMTDRIGQLGELKKPSDKETLQQFVQSGVKFVVSSDSASDLEDVYYEAIYRLLDCIKPNARGEGILQEGGVYDGCWLESTGTINTELLSRFVPEVARATFEQFARHQREDGLIPYKISKDEPTFRQIQLVTPLARSVWNHYKLNGENKAFLMKMFDALVHYDEWLATYRNMRGTGCVEAFCTFDTGHDLSARFWHVPDTPYEGDPKRYDPNSPVLPFLAPDLTASVYCSRKYIGKMGGELGDELSDELSDELEGGLVDGREGDEHGEAHNDAQANAQANAQVQAEWEAKAEQSLHSLMTYCYDEEDQFFYDVDRHDRFVRIQTDVLLRVLASEVGDAAMFDRMLQKYLLNMRKFFAKYPLTSVAMDDPRYDPHSTYNTWSGATNFLTLIRTPHAFEHHQRYVELTWIMMPIMNAMARFERFGQVLSSWTGEEGYTESYSPAILGVLDFIERCCGVLPRPDGDVWATALLPAAMDHGLEIAKGTGYSRAIDGKVFELIISRETTDGADSDVKNKGKHATLYIDGHKTYSFPEGLRMVTNRDGELKAVIGMSARTVEGVLTYRDATYPIKIAGNQVWTYENGALQLKSDPGVIYPTYE